MSTVDVEPLIIRQSPRRLLTSAAVLAAFLCAYPILGALGVIDPWLMWAGTGLFSAMLVLGLVTAFKARTAGWELRLDEHGATVRDHATIPWSDIAEVRIRSMFPRWIPPVMRSYYVVAFGGRTGALMPSLPSARIGLLSGWGERARDRRFGTRLVLPPMTFDASTTAIVHAVERFSSVPIIGHQDVG